MSHEGSRIQDARSARLKRCAPSQRTSLPLKICQTAAGMEVRHCNSDLNYMPELPFSIHKLAQHTSSFCFTMQVLHSVLGVVKSPFFTTCMPLHAQPSWPCHSCQTCKSTLAPCNVHFVMDGTLKVLGQKQLDLSCRNV